LLLIDIAEWRDTRIMPTSSQAALCWIDIGMVDHNEDTTEDTSGDEGEDMSDDNGGTNDRERG
jgi:hypothetical protein